MGGMLDAAGQLLRLAETDKTAGHLVH